MVTNCQCSFKST